MINDFLKDKRIHMHHRYPDVLPSVEKRFCDPISITVTALAISGGVKAYGEYQQGQAQQAMYSYQSALAVQEATATRKYAKMQEKAIGEAAAANITAEQAAAAEESRRLARDVAELSGQQRATIGALGIGGVTAADIAVSTFDKARLDQLAIRYNANIRSWGIREQAKRDIWTLGEETKMKTWALKAEASQLKLAGKQTKKAARIGTATTLLSTAASMASVGALRVPTKAAGGGGAVASAARGGGYARLTF